MNNNSVKLTAVQREVLYGILLGDASLKTQTEGRTYSLHVAQTMEVRATTPDKSPYVHHLYDLYRSLVNPNTPPAILKSELGRRLGFTTLVQDSLRYYGQQFYRNATDEEKLLRKETGHKNQLLYVKIVPKDIHKHLTDRALAYWYMDDGALKGGQNQSRTGKNLNTQGFTEEEVVRLSDALLTVGIHATVNKDHRRKLTKTYYKLYIRARSDSEFTERIRPYVLPVFKYKLDAP